MWIFTVVSPHFSDLTAVAAHLHKQICNNQRETSVFFQSRLSPIDMLWVNIWNLLFLFSLRLCFPMIALGTPPHKKLSSLLGATSVPFCMVVGLKLSTAWLPPLSVSHASTREPMVCECGIQQGTSLGHPLISGSGVCVCEERDIKRGTSVATGLWRPGTIVAPGQPQSPGPCRKG